MPVAGIARAFRSGAGPALFPALGGWCCSPKSDAPGAQLSERRRWQFGLIGLEVLRHQWRTILERSDLIHSSSRPPE